MNSFVCNWGSLIELGRSPEKEAMPTPFDRRYHLTSKEFWSAYFGQEHTLFTLTSKSHYYSPRTLYPTAQITLSQTPSHSSEWLHCQQAQYRRWFTMKHSKADLSPKIQPPICLDYRACNRATELHERGTYEKGWCVIHWSSRKAKPQSTGCSKSRST